MDWFVAVVLYRSSSDAPDYVSLYEETILAVRAETLDAARAKAEGIARSRQAAYRNEDGEMITVLLVHVVDVAPMLEAPEDDGAELYSRHFRDLAAYESFNAAL